jgi:hypothetical protein
MTVSKRKFMNNPDVYLKKAEVEDVYIMEGKHKVIAVIRAEKYDAYKPVGNEFDPYNWQ